MSMASSTRKDRSWIPVALSILLSPVAAIIVLELITGGRCG